MIAAELERSGSVLEHLETVEAIHAVLDFQRSGIAQQVIRAIDHRIRWPDNRRRSSVTGRF